MQDTRAGYRCPACRERMHLVPLPGLHGSAVEVDHCRTCRLVWFDALEPSALGQGAWVALLSELARPHAAEAMPWGDGRLPCPRCDAPLQASTQVSAFGRSVRLACPAGHGQAQRDGALLASRGLFRPLLLDERVLLARERRRLQCLPCGAPLGDGAERCSHCDSPATVFDLPRLAQALGLLDAPAGGDAPLQPWPCRGCGAPLDVTHHPACPQCGRAVLAPAPGDLAPLLEAAGARLAHRTAEAARKALPARAAAEHGRIHALTQREEHGEVMRWLEARFWRRWAGVVAVFAALWSMAWCTSRW